MRTSSVPMDPAEKVGFEVFFCCWEGLKASLSAEHYFQSLTVNVNVFYRSRSSFTQDEGFDFCTWRDFWFYEALLLSLNTSFGYKMMPDIPPLVHY